MAKRKFLRPLLASSFEFDGVGSSSPGPVVRKMTTRGPCRETEKSTLFRKKKGHGTRQICRGSSAHPQGGRFKDDKTVTRNGKLSGESSAID